jgi:hypothetical protein
VAHGVGVVGYLSDSFGGYTPVAMEDTWNFVTENVLPHYPFVVGYFGFVLVGQFMKHQVWTKGRATTKGKGQKFYHFMRRTLALHAPITGLGLGAIPGMVASPGVEWFWGTVMYWFGCGIFASFSFHAFSDYVKKKTDGKIDLEESIEDAVNPSMRPSPVPGDKPK